MHSSWLLQPPPSTVTLTLLLLPLILSSSPSPAFVSGDKYSDCADKTSYCGGSRLDLAYPFFGVDRPDYCGYPGFNITCTDEDIQSFTIEIDDKKFVVKAPIDYSEKLLDVVESEYFGKNCPESGENVTLNNAIFDYYPSFNEEVMLFMGCSSPFDGINALAPSCPKPSYYSTEPWINLPNFGLLASRCKLVTVRMNRTVLSLAYNNDPTVFLQLLQDGFTLVWKAGPDLCQRCNSSGGRCGYDFAKHRELCFCDGGYEGGSPCDSGQDNKKSDGKKIGIGVGVGCAALLLGTSLFLLYMRVKKRNRHSSQILVTHTSSTDPSSKSNYSKNDSNFGVSHYRTHVFTYEELEDATEGFSPSRELGDGGFGTVYKGTLPDGRVIAVKRLYENNFKRVEQFMNEVDILSGLHHKNLVILYGCTSRHSRELLLVYEYVPNGTVADHLFGPRATERGLPWPVRLSIAMETADALRYLHGVEPQIIHRDVKTNNILLDNDFHVKVADFGLSRLFPLNATHVSTAPQGTPGYVDPEYHQCYQLTDKSDVYSFGVVLAELISSMPAVDISRHRSEINLANMLIGKMQSNILWQIVDSRTGYHTDLKVKRMVDLVAELAFRCLQTEREMRPSIKQVLDELREIERAGLKNTECTEADDVVRQDACLLKDKPPCSPASVMQNWRSESTTPGTSG